jgi:hypothetical protein
MRLAPQPTSLPSVRTTANLQIHGLEASPIAEIAPRDHEHPIAAIVDRLGIPWRRRHVGLHDLEDEEAVSIDPTPVDQSALEIRVALRDERRGDLRCPDRCKAKLLELVTFVSVRSPCAGSA